MLERNESGRKGHAYVWLFASSSQLLLSAAGCDAVRRAWSAPAVVVPSLVRDEATCDVDAVMISLSRCRPWSWTMDEGGYYAK